MAYCRKCGTQQYDDAAFCHACGKQLGSPSVPAYRPITVATAPAREVTFYSNSDVMVTNARFIVPGQTYAIANVTSVRLEQIDPTYAGAIWCIVLGIIAGVASLVKSSWIGFVGLGFIITGIIWAASLKTEYAVALFTAGGEQRAIVSQDGAYVEEIVEALNEAIVYRN